MRVVDDSSNQVSLSQDPHPDLEVLTAALHAELVSRSKTLATAESLTGGGLAELVSAAAGSSDTYLGGVVAYASAVKQQVLGVSAGTVATHGVVSAACAAEMALGVRSLVGADYGVSTTGVAGPTEQEGKPVGLVYVAVAGPGGVTTKELHLRGDRSQVRQRTCLEAVSAAIAVVRGGLAQ